MLIKFEKLKISHFTLLYKWLMTHHVRKWWDSEVNWTEALIEKKYSEYVKGYKRLTLPNRIIEKPIHAYIIVKDGKEIGYIQFYNKHDFPSEYNYDILELPDKLAAIDWYIGEVEYINQGIGSLALNLFIENYVFKNFEAVFVDPDNLNIPAIRTYKKIGFRVIKEVNGITWMIKNKCLT